MNQNRSDDFRKAIQDRQNEAGRFNLAIFGKTGAGKSTLIHAIFGEEVAATGIGEPVTKANHLHVHRSTNLGIFDTVGLEIGKNSNDILAEVREYIEATRHKPLTAQIHVAWYCVRFGDRRFEDVEAEFVTQLKQLGIPVVLVMTQAPMRHGVLHPEIATFAGEIDKRKLPVCDRRTFPTMAVGDPFYGMEAHGLLEVLDATFRVAPEGVAAALTAAQRIDMNRKDKDAREITAAATAAAAAAGASPIPFSDAALLVPIQLGMMAGITHTYGVDVDKGTTAAIAATAAASAGGRALVGSALKLIPIVGTLVGGAINATVAGAITFAMGTAWAGVCHQLAEGKLTTIDGLLDTEAIHRMFTTEFKSRFTTRMKNPDPKA